MKYLYEFFIIFILWFFLLLTSYLVYVFLHMKILDIDNQ